MIFGVHWLVDAAARSLPSPYTASALCAHLCPGFSYFINLFLKRFYTFIFRGGEGKEKERERNISV